MIDLKQTCYEKEAVLHPEQNQIINLTTYHPHYRDLAGCIAIEQSVLTTPTPKSVTSTQNYKSTTRVPSTKKTTKKYIPELQITASTTESTKLNETSYMLNETYGSLNESAVDDLLESQIDGNDSSTFNYTNIDVSN